MGPTGIRIYNRVMFRSRATRRFTTWLAMWAMALGALLPVLSQAAVRLTDQADWVEICTATGMAWVHAETGQITESPPDDSMVSAMSGCGWCLMHGGATGLPPSHGPTFSAPTGSAAALSALDTRLVAHRGWPSALSRAPPLNA